jgi:3-hydroxyacyl-CoA dehydrogenase
MGMVKIRKEGEMKRRSIKTLKTLTPPLTINSTNLRSLSISRMMVKVKRPMRKMGRVSLKI